MSTTEAPKKRFSIKITLRKPKKEGLKVSKISQAETSSSVKGPMRRLSNKLSSLNIRKGLIKKNSSNWKKIGLVEYVTKQPELKKLAPSAVEDFEDDTLTNSTIMSSPGSSFDTLSKLAPSAVEDFEDDTQTNSTITSSPGSSFDTLNKLAPSTVEDFEDDTRTNSMSISSPGSSFDTSHTSSVSFAHPLVQFSHMENEVTEYSVSALNNAPLPTEENESIFEAGDTRQTSLLPSPSVVEAPESDMSESSMSMKNSMSLPEVEFVPNIKARSGTEPLPTITNEMVFERSVDTREKTLLTSTSSAVEACKRDGSENSMSVVHSTSLQAVDLVPQSSDKEKTSIVEASSNTKQNLLIVPTPSAVESPDESSISAVNITSLGSKTRHMQFEEPVKPIPLVVSAFEDKQTPESCLLATDSSLRSIAKESSDKRLTWFRKFALCCSGEEEGCKEGALS